MFDLIGRPYRLGGGDGAIDCIQLVYTVLERLDISTPPFDPAWYDASQRTIARALLRWGGRVPCPAYDGDVVLLRQPDKAFAVTWQHGLFYIERVTETVAWSPIGRLQAAHSFRHYSRTSEI